MRIVRVAVRAAEQRILERVNIALSLTFMSSALIVSTATMLTLIAYTSAGNHLSPIQVGNIIALISFCTAPLNRFVRVMAL